MNKLLRAPTLAALVLAGLGGCDPEKIREIIGEIHPGDPGHGGHGPDGCGGDADEPDDTARVAASVPVYWKQPGATCENPVRLKLFAWNDFHGQLSAGRRVANRPVGGAAVMASHLKAARVGWEERSVLVHAGDHVGGTPAASALLQDEPSISFINMLANKHCKRQHRDHPRCDVVGTVGNHEFDEGKTELLRLLDGGNHPAGPFLDSNWTGASYPSVCANVVETATGQPLLPPYVIKKLAGVSVGFVGAVLKETPTVVTPTGVAGLTFQDEAEAINRAVADLRRKQVRTIVVTIHQGGTQTSYTGPTQAMPPTLNGPAIADIVRRLDDEVDLVVSGHAHAFTNTLLATASGKPILVTQAFSNSTAYGDIELGVDPATGDVISKTASIVTTWGDEGPGLTPDQQVAALVKAAEDKVAPLVNQVVGTAAVALTRTESPAGESNLGNLIADAQRAATGTQVAFMNPGGIRADIAAGPVTWGTLFAVQPFANSLVRMDLSGQDIKDLLEQQWAGQPFPRIMKSAGISYSWSATLPVGARVSDIRVGGVPVDPMASYAVTVNNFMATGGDNFTVLLRGRNQVGGDVDLDALIAHVRSLPQPFSAAVEGRITLLP
jgi:5'-nucleotidase